jgi:hypothetical protein
MTGPPLWSITAMICATIVHGDGHLYTGRMLFVASMLGAALNVLWHNDTVWGDDT